MMDKMKRNILLEGNLALIEGHKNNKLYIIESGSIRVVTSQSSDHMKSKIKSTMDDMPQDESKNSPLIKAAGKDMSSILLKSSHYFGEYFLFKLKSRNTYIAEENSIVWSITGDQFRQV